MSKQQLIEESKEIAKEKFENQSMVVLLKGAQDFNELQYLLMIDLFFNDFLPDHLSLIYDKAVEEIREKINDKLKLHTHNSIPSYDADYKEGCILCIENRKLMDILSTLTPKGEK